MAKRPMSESEYLDKVKAGTMKKDEELENYYRENSERRDNENYDENGYAYQTSPSQRHKEYR